MSSSTGISTSAFLLSEGLLWIQNNDNNDANDRDSTFHAPLLNSTRKVLIQLGCTVPKFSDGKEHGAAKHVVNPYPMTSSPAVVATATATTVEATTSISDAVSTTCIQESSAILEENAIVESSHEVGGDADNNANEVQCNSPSNDVVPSTTNVPSLDDSNIDVVNQKKKKRRKNNKNFNPEIVSINEISSAMTTATSDGRQQQNFESFQRVTELASNILLALSDISKFKNRMNDDTKNNGPFGENSTVATTTTTTIVSGEASNSNKKKMNGGGNRIEKKMEALEHQRIRLQESKLQQQNSASNSDDGDEDDDDDGNCLNNDDDIMMINENSKLENVTDDEGTKDDGNEVAAIENKDSDEDDIDSNTCNIEDRWILVARTLNSLRMLTPIILQICFHPYRNNTNLVMGNSKHTLEQGSKNGRRSGGDGSSRRNRDGRNAKCWLIYESGCNGAVYDWSSQKMCKTIDQQLRITFQFLGCNHMEAMEPTIDHDKSPSKMWELAIDQIMETVRIFGSTTKGLLPDVDNKPTLKIIPASNPCISTKPHWVDYHPFDEFSDTDRASFQRIGLQLDVHFGLQYAITKETQLINQQYSKSIESLHERLSDLLKARFPSARLSLYGSCLSDLSLGKAADVDFSLHMDNVKKVRDDFENGKVTVASYQQRMKRIVYDVTRTLESCGRDNFRNMIPVVYARVPVVKGTYMRSNNPHSANGSIDFDICFLNDIAVANSSLLREYSLIDPRVKQLMISVKKWAKHNNISSATSPDNCISSYAWMILVVFYLQCIGIVPNLQCPKLIKEVGILDRNNYWHSVNNLDTCYVTWEQAKHIWNEKSKKEVGSPFLLESNSTTSIAALLYGFFHFYSRKFPSAICLISMKRDCTIPLPSTVFHKPNFFFTIEDPFELYDSHCPHDLALPASDIGSQKIIKCLNEAERNIRNIFLLSLKNVRVIPFDKIVKIWPLPIAQKRVATGHTKDNITNRNVGHAENNKERVGKSPSKPIHNRNEEKNQTPTNTSKREVKSQGNIRDLNLSKGRNNTKSSNSKELSKESESNETKQPQAQASLKRNNLINDKIQTNVNFSDKIKTKERQSNNATNKKQQAQVALKRNNLITNEVQSNDNSVNKSVTKNPRARRNEKRYAAKIERSQQKGNDEAKDSEKELQKAMNR